MKTNSFDTSEMVGRSRGLAVTQGSKTSTTLTKRLDTLGSTMSYVTGGIDEEMSLVKAYGEIRVLDSFGHSVTVLVFCLFWFQCVHQVVEAKGVPAPRLRVDFFSVRDTRGGPPKTEELKKTWWKSKVKPFFFQKIPT